MQIQSEIKKGTISVFVAKYSNIFIGLVLNSVLARLLSPGEYGTLGVITVFTLFFNILSDIGIGAAIVQSQDLTKRDLSDLFKLSILLSALLGILFGVLSYGIAWYYKDIVYISIGKLLAISVFFSSVSVVPKTILTKRQAFSLIGIIEVSLAVVTGILAIFLAKYGWSYYSIVWRSISSSACIFVLYLYFSKLKIEVGFTISGFRKIARYSFFQFAFNFINYFSRNTDNILVGKFMGKDSLGIYSQAYQLMMHPVANLTHVITPVLLPVLAKFQNEPKIIFHEYSKVVKTLAMLGIPISIFLFFSVNEIVYIVLGEQWGGVIPILRIFSVTIWIQMITSSAGVIFQALGRTDMLFKLGIVSTSTIVVSIIAGVIYFRSLEYTAIFLNVAFVVNFIFVFYVLIEKMLGESLLIFAKDILAQLGISFGLIAAFLIYEYFFPEHESLVLYSLLIKSFIGISIFSLFNLEILKVLYRKARYGYLL